MLSSIGLVLPRSLGRTLFGLLGKRLRLKLRGLRFRERPAAEVPAELLLRIDTCRSIAMGLANVQPMLGMSFATSHLFHALEAGEPYRLSLALALEAAYSAAAGSKSHRRTAGLVAAASALADRVAEVKGQPHAQAMALFAAGIAQYFEGNASRALELLLRADTVLRERCTGVAWELDTVLFYSLRVLRQLGNVAQIRLLVPATLKDVMARGDLYAETCLRSAGLWLCELSEDRPAEALAEIETARGKWSQEGFHPLHYVQLVARVDIANYLGEGDRAWATLEAAWPKLERSQMLRFQLVSVDAHNLRARAACAAAALPGQSENGQEEAAGGRRRLARQGRKTPPRMGAAFLPARPRGARRLPRRQRRSRRAADSGRRRFRRRRFRAARRPLPPPRAKWSAAPKEKPRPPPPTPGWQGKESATRSVSPPPSCRDRGASLPAVVFEDGHNRRLRSGTLGADPDPQGSHVGPVVAPVRGCHHRFRAAGHHQATILADVSPFPRKSPRKPPRGRPLSLERVISKAGYGSRTEARRWIAEGRVEVNGEVASDPELWVDLGHDRVCCDGEPCSGPSGSTCCSTNPPATSPPTATRRASARSTSCCRPAPLRVPGRPPRPRHQRPAGAHQRQRFGRAPHQSRARGAQDLRGKASSFLSDDELERLRVGLGWPTGRPGRPWSSGCAIPAGAPFSRSPYAKPSNARCAGWSRRWAPRCSRWRGWRSGRSRSATCRSASCGRSRLRK